MCSRWVHARIFNAVFTTFPESTSVSVGQHATFFCAGYGQILAWFVDDIAAMFHGGVKYSTKVVNGLRESNLTVFGTTENNNVSIACLIVVGTVIHDAPLAYLTLLGESKERLQGRTQDFSDGGAQTLGLGGLCSKIYRIFYSQIPKILSIILRNFTYYSQKLSSMFDIDY